MNNLPQELINKIALQLERCPDQQRVPLLLQECTKDSKLPPYATLSRQWKNAVEFITFRSLKVWSDRLSDFRTHVTGNRRNYLTRLVYDIVLPEYPKEVYGHVETAQEQQANSEAFTRAISDLFATLKSWEDEGLQSTLRLELPYRGAYSQADLRVEHMVDTRPRRGVDIFEKRFAHSLLEMSDSVNFPCLSNVPWLVIRGNSPRKLAPYVGISLAAHLPNLKTISWHFGESDEKDKMVENRIKFAQALDQTQMPHCSAADLVFYQGEVKLLPVSLQDQD